MRPPPRLSNCYVPQLRAAPPPTDDDDAAAADLWRLRKERVLRQRMFETKENRTVESTSAAVTAKRYAHELRRLRLESNVILPSPSSSLVSGSSLVEWGHTKVLCTVIGPVTSACAAVPTSATLDLDQGTLLVDVKYVPATGYPADQIPLDSSSLDAAQQQQHQQNKARYNFVSQREQDVASRVWTALSAAVPLSPYPKCAIVLQCTVIHDDGSVLPACLTAACLALAEAGFELYDVVTACTVAVVSVPAPPRSANAKPTGDKVRHETEVEPSPPLPVVLLADPTLEEIAVADCTVTLAMLSNWKEVTLWEQLPIAGAMPMTPASTTNAAVNLCQDGCRTMHRFIREHLLAQTSQYPSHVERTLESGSTSTNKETDMDTTT